MYNCGKEERFICIGRIIGEFGTKNGAELFSGMNFFQEQDLSAFRAYLIYLFFFFLSVLVKNSYTLHYASRALVQE